MLPRLVFLFTAFSLISKRADARGRFKQELKMIQCLCTAPLPERLERIGCLNHYSDINKSGFEFSKIVQYCGYFSDKTKFGYYTGKNRLQMAGYNPFADFADLYTDKTCSYTKYTPGVSDPPSVKYSTPKGWIIAKCIMNMAGMDAYTGDWSYYYCCNR